MRPLLIVVLLAAASAAFYAGFESDFFSTFLSPTVTVRLPAVSSSDSQVGASAGFTVSVPIPAVSRTGEGALAEFSVTTRPGTGKLFLQSDSGSPLANPDTQLSIRTAVDVARQLAGASAPNADVFVSFQASSDLVSGASAGAGVAVATLAALKGTPLKTSVLVTGSVTPEGKITAVGKVLEKARAAAASGIVLMLVPRGEMTATIEKSTCNSESIDDAYYRSCKPVSVTVQVATESGIDVLEVDSVLQAYELMRNH